MSNAEGYLKLYMETFRDGDQYVARCKTLGLVAYGPTADDTDERITEMVSEALRLARQEGVLDEYLKSHDVAIQHSIETITWTNIGTDRTSALAIAPVPVG